MTPTTRRYTVADLEQFPEDGNRYEIIDGELYVTSAPGFSHQYTAARLAFQIEQCDPDEKRGTVIGGPGLVFADDQSVIPDLIWVSWDRAREVLLDPTTGGRGTRLYGAPELVVEVLSPGTANEERDRIVKRALYVRHGVLEYWIASVERETIEVYRRAGASLDLVETVQSGRVLQTPLLPNCRISLARVFRLPRDF